MRPSLVTAGASIPTSPASAIAIVPRCVRCQSLMQPSLAEYWHIGATTMRLGSVTPPSWMGVKSLGSGKLDSFFQERLADRLRERHGARLVAVQANGVCPHGYRFSIQAFEFPL